LNFQVAGVGIVRHGEDLQDLVGHCAGRNAGGKSLHVISKARIGPPAKSGKLTNPFWREHAFKGRLHQCSSRFATQIAVGQTFALNVFISIPDGGVSVLAGAIQIQNVLQRRFDASLIRLRRLSDAGNWLNKQRRESGSTQRKRTHYCPL